MVPPWSIEVQEVHDKKSMHDTRCTLSLQIAIIFKPIIAISKKNKKLFVAIDKGYTTTI
jgi:hypothetical protein